MNKFLLPLGQSVQKFGNQLGHSLGKLGRFTAIFVIGNSVASKKLVDLVHFLNDLLLGH
jgi:hypothetical protein